MRNFRKFNLLFLVMIFLLAISLHGPLMAQDDLMTNTPVAEVTPEPVVTPAPVVDEPIDQPGTLVGLLNFVVGAVTGAVVTLTGTFAIIGRIKNDKPMLDLIEALGKSVPAEVTLKLNELGRSVRDAGEVIDAVTDGQPNEVGDAIEVPPMDAEYYRNKFGRSWQGEPPII